MMKNYNTDSRLTSDEKRELRNHARMKAANECNDNDALVSEAAFLGYLAARLYFKKRGREKSGGTAMPKEIISSFVSDYIARERQRSSDRKPSDSKSGAPFPTLIKEMKKLAQKVKDIIRNNTVHL